MSLERYASGSRSLSCKCHESACACQLRSSVSLVLLSLRMVKAWCHCRVFPSTSSHHAQRSAGSNMCVSNRHLESSSGYILPFLCCMDFCFFFSPFLLSVLYLWVICLGFAFMVSFPLQAATFRGAPKYPTCESGCRKLVVDPFSCSLLLGFLAVFPFSIACFLLSLFSLALSFPFSPLEPTEARLFVVVRYQLAAHGLEGA